MLSGHYTFNIKLCNSNPIIWRRITVNTELNFEHFHGIITSLMAWKNWCTSSFNFHIPGKSFVKRREHPWVDPNDMNYILDVHTLASVLEEKKGFYYSYSVGGLGGSWFIYIYVEGKTSQFDMPYPRGSFVDILSGSRSAPPEFCSGIEEYNKLVAKMKGGCRKSAIMLWEMRPNAEFGTYTVEWSAREIIFTKMRMQKILFLHYQEHK